MLTTATAQTVPGFSHKSIKEFPLDERAEYRLSVAQDEVTTVMFPGVISALEAAGATSDVKAKAPMLLSFTPGNFYFSVRALEPEARASLNVIWNGKTYVLKLQTGETPFNSVTFYEPEEDLRQPGQRKPVPPNKLLHLMDRAKAFHLIRNQYPGLISQIDHALPMTQTFYRDFKVVVKEAFRFDPEDTIILNLAFVNETDKDIHYQPQAFSVRVGKRIYPASLADASGVIPAGSHSSAFIAITGKPNGGRHNLSVKSTFNVIVVRQPDAEPESEAVQP